jgi:hypothetical protein
MGIGECGHAPISARQSARKEDVARNLNGVDLLYDADSIVWRFAVAKWLQFGRGWGNAHSARWYPASLCGPRAVASERRGTFGPEAAEWKGRARRPAP